MVCFRPTIQPRQTRPKQKLSDMNWLTRPLFTSKPRVDDPYNVDANIVAWVILVGWILLWLLVLVAGVLGALRNPLFIIDAAWSLCLVLAVLLLFTRHRYLSTYLVIAPTCGLILSLVLAILGTSVLFSINHHYREAGGEMSKMMTIVLLGAIVIEVGGGLVVGLLLGFVLASRLNSRIGWLAEPNREATSSTR